MPGELLVGGPAGTGKTFGILSALHVVCAENPGLRVLFARETRASLADSVLAMFEEEVLPSDGYEGIIGKASREHRRGYYYPNGTRIRLAGLDNWERLKSSKWDIIFVNEATGLRLEAWEGLGSRLNRPGSNPDFGWLIGDCNPADPMHPLKLRCDAGITTLWETTHKANPALYSRRRRDWRRAGRTYIERLQRLTGTSYQRLYLGLWAAGEGAWFAAFDDAADVHATADYFPGAGPVHLAIDCNGGHIAAVWFQVRDGDGGPHICVFADYYSDDKARHAQVHARAILKISRERCGHRIRPEHITGDPSGSAHSGLGTTVRAEYAKAGLPFNHWIKRPGSVLDGLALIETFLGGNLHVHPRCNATRTALLNFRRKRVKGQWVDEPEDPQHPHEDVIEALRGGLLAIWPNGRRADLKLASIRGQYLP